MLGAIDIRMMIFEIGQLPWEKGIAHGLTRILRISADKVFILNP
jgi:hypothetical protein